MSLGTLGKYELLEKIAEGGMGELFRAREVGPAGFERIVALKRIRGSMIADPRSRQMFIEEARIASFVIHANLVTLFQFEEEGDLLYLVMELVEGRDLAKILARCRQQRDPLGVRFAVRIAEQVALGLDYLHRLGKDGQPLQVVHRDVSPQNVLVSYEGVVKLTDFGIAYMRRSEPVTQTGILKGKMGYMTPEQLSEKRIDGRADIFCLGIVLWEMLTGARLFQGTSDASVLEQVLHKRIPLPSTLNENVPLALDRIVMRALERDRARRFERAGEMAAALHALEGYIATDAELGQELRRYFPDKPAPQAVPPAPAPVEPRTESVSTAVDRPQTVPSAEVAIETTGRAPTEPEPSPSAPSVTVPGIRRRSQRTRRYLSWAALALFAGCLLLIGRGHLWARMHHAPSGTFAPAAVVNDEPPAATKEVVAESRVLSAGSASPTAESPATTPAPPAPTAKTKDTPEPRTVAETSAVPTEAETHREVVTHHSTLLWAKNVSPWTEVVVDGTSLGYSAHSWKVASGHHHLLLRNHKAGIEREFDLEFPAGGEVHLQGKLRSLQPELVR